MSQVNDMDIFCADIGSVSQGNFGWYVLYADGTSDEGADIRALGTAVADALNKERRVSLGFEAPMFVPFRRDPYDLTKKRAGETNPNWIGGPGATVLATGLVQVPWILTDIKGKITGAVAPTLDWSIFDSHKANFFLWEAFVSGDAKGTNHIDDARIGVEAFIRTLPNPLQCNVISEPAVFSLLGAALVRTGWSSTNRRGTRCR